MIVAHGGDSQQAPENTLAAFEHAILRGADSIEFDVHMTKDGELVIHHDYYLGRTEDGEGYLGDFTLAELKQFDIGSWFGQTWSGERMPTLDEVLMCGQGRVRFELEIRTPSHDCIKRIIESVVRHDVCKMVEITSPHFPSCIRSRLLMCLAGSVSFSSPVRVGCSFPLDSSIF